MSIEITCGDGKCDWWDERKSSEIPYRCPNCGGPISRASAPVQPGETKSDKI